MEIDTGLSVKPARRPVVGDDEHTHEHTHEHVDDHVNHAYTTNKDALLKRLARIEGQVRGIGRMVDEEKYCIDILTQISAINAALHKVSLGLVEDHVAHCVVDAAIRSQETGDQSFVADKVAEVTTAIGRLLR